MLVDTMRLAYPLQSVIPSAHGAVLGVLARTFEPMTGRRIATLTRPRFSQSRVNRLLGELARDGIADVDVRPPASTTSSTASTLLPRGFWRWRRYGQRPRHPPRLSGRATGRRGVAGARGGWRLGQTLSHTTCAGVPSATCAATPTTATCVQSGHPVVLS